MKLSHKVFFFIVNLLFLSDGIFVAMIILMIFFPFIAFCFELIELQQRRFGKNYHQFRYNELACALSLSLSMNLWAKNRRYNIGINSSKWKSEHVLNVVAIVVEWNVWFFLCVFLCPTINENQVSEKQHTHTPAHVPRSRKHKHKRIERETTTTGYFSLSFKNQ